LESKTNNSRCDWWSSSPNSPPSFDSCSDDDKTEDECGIIILIPEQTLKIRFGDIKGAFPLLIQFETKSFGKRKRPPQESVDLFLQVTNQQKITHN